jgi:hypothetical protein
MKRSLLLSFLLLAASARAAIVNVALDAPAYLNGTLFGGDTIVRLTDGARDRQIHADASPPAGFAYWIDLGTSHAIDHIRIWPRQDGCCGDRFSKVRVSVHDDDGTGSIGAEVWHADLFADGSNPGSAAGTVVNVTGGMGSGTFAGQWVKLTALGDPLPDYALQVTELEVFANGTPSVSLGAAATSSAPLYSGRSIANLVDGVRTGPADEVLHGDVAFNPYDPLDTIYRYEINLGATANLEQIKIIARQDGCCADRLSNYRVSIHLDDQGAIGDEVWAAALHTDFSNPGSGPGAKDVLIPELDPGGVFAGQWIRIAALDASYLSYSLQMGEVEAYGTFPSGPILRPIRQPQALKGALGRTAVLSFEAAAAGGDPSLLTYQWKKNGANIPGATAATYTLPPLTTADETNLFNCVVSYPGLTSVTSDTVGIDIDYAFGAAAFANGPLWGLGGWTIGLIVDGDHDADGVFSGVHGDTGLPLGFAYWFDMHINVTLSNIIIWARQDVCCGSRLTNYRVSVHEDDHGQIGAEVWGADMHTDGSNAGVGAGAKDMITADLDPGGVFAGRWVRITSLENPVPNYALQITEVEVFGGVPPEIKVAILQQPASANSSPFRTATFRMDAAVLNGDPANLRFQWQRNGTDISGATGRTYTTPPLCEEDRGSNYRCRVSYPGIADTLTDEATLFFDYNYARGSQAYANQPLWGPGGWNISMLVDGDRLNVFHGGENIAPDFAYTVNLGFPVDIEHIYLFPRQDPCCAARFTNLRVSVHNDNGSGAIGDEVWGTDLYTDGSNPGSGPGIVVSLTADLDVGGVFAGQWIKILSLQNPVPDYSLQMTELEVVGKARALCFKVGDNGQLSLSWDHGTLVSAAEVAGPYTPVQGAVSPLPINSNEARRFYRLTFP